MKIKYIFTLLISVNFIFSSCSDYLDVSDELSGGLQDIDQVFDNVGYTKRFYANAMSGVPDYSGLISANGFSNPWAVISDEITSGFGKAAGYTQSDKNSASVKFHRWGTAYKLIRQANILLKHIKPIEPSGTQGDELTPELVAEMKANTRFMRAYYHFLLFEQYGSIQLVKDSIYGSEDNLDIPRAPLDEVINYIDEELLAVSKELDQNVITDEQFLALPSKGVALAVRAKLWMYAASPLLNGGYTEALHVMTPYGSDGAEVRMYPDYDAGKWEKALAAVKDFIDYANQGNYELYSTGNPMNDVYELFQKYNNEIIWATSKNNWGGMNADAVDRRSTPRSEPNGIGQIGVYQRLVDDFYMNDGLPIQETSFLPASPEYTEEGFSNVNGEQVFNMWVNREARFYNTVFYQGRKWHISNNVIKFHAGSGNDRGGQHTKSGYLLYKRYNRTIHKKWPGVVNKFRPSIIFRLADFYLLYAEALNEVNSSDPQILEYVNKVRVRAGLPNLEVLNVAIVGNYEMQRDAIVRERRVELATEGQRYFDLRRWMIAEKSESMQNSDMYGMNMAGDESEFFTRTKIERNVFNRKMYLYPVPYFEMQKTKGALVQNPGWN